MKAIRIHAFGEPSVLKFEEVPDPTPGPNQVLIDVRAIGVNPVDTYIRAGKYGPREFPFTPGFDAAGVILAVGPGVSTFKPGDRVYTCRTTSGAYASKALADQHTTFALEDRVTFQQGAALGIPYNTAYRALHHRGRAAPAEIVLVHGATGGVGLAAVQLARAFGCTVVGTGGSDEGRKLAAREGAHHVLDHHDPNYLMRIKEIAQPRSGGAGGVDLILEMLANVNLDKDLTLLSRNGRVVVIGSRGRIEIDPRETMGREADIRGMTLNNATPAELAISNAAIRAGLENNTLRPIIDSELPLSEAPRAHAEVLEGNSRGKVVLVP